jgi:hypothetical protein
MGGKSKGGKSAKSEKSAGGFSQKSEKKRGAYDAVKT